MGGRGSGSWRSLWVLTFLSSGRGVSLLSLLRFRHLPLCLSLSSSRSLALSLSLPSLKEGLILYYPAGFSVYNFSILVPPFLLHPFSSALDPPSSAAVDRSAPSSLAPAVPSARLLLESTSMFREFSQSDFRRAAIRGANLVKARRAAPRSCPAMSFPLSLSLSLPLSPSPAPAPFLPLVAPLGCGLRLAI